jgi:hypothetical protein
MFFNGDMYVPGCPGKGHQQDVPSNLSVTAGEGVKFVEPVEPYKAVDLMYVRIQREVEARSK